MTTAATVTEWVKVSSLLHGWFQWVFPILAGIGVLALYFFSLLRSPLRRQQRCLLLLDLIESGLQLGLLPERFIASMAHLRDPDFDPLFYRLAARLEMGERLPAALAQIPEFANPTLIALLNIGHEIGNYQAVLLACRASLNDAGAENRVAINYYFALAGLLNPLIVIIPFLAATVLPVFDSVLNAFGHRYSSAEWLRGLCLELWFAHLLILLLLICARFWNPLYFSRWIRDLDMALVDRLLVLLAWRKAECLRDFIGALATLLDAGLPENRSVELAASTLDNPIWQDRARKVQAELQSGAKLTRAVQNLDDSGELQWRLENGARAGHGFVRALRGWQELLSANAFRRQQISSQLMTTSLIIFNGITVAACAGLAIYFITWVSGASL